MSAPSDSTLTPSAILRRANDYDEQIREGLENGNVRLVVRRLGTKLVSGCFFVLLLLLIW